MMYIHPASLEKLGLDISSFYDTATGRIVAQETPSELEH
jgi:hypothetical protein